MVATAQASLYNVSHKFSVLLCMCPHIIALPSLAVMVDYNGTMSIGSFLTLSCEVQVVEGLIVQPDIARTKRAVSDGGGNNTISVGAVQTDNTLTLTYTSDAGEYTCTAAVNVSVINLIVTNSSKLDVRTQSELSFPYKLT